MKFITILLFLSFLPQHHTQKQPIGIFTKTQIIDNCEVNIRTHTSNIKYLPYIPRIITKIPRHSLENGTTIEFKFTYASNQPVVDCIFYDKYGNDLGSDRIIKGNFKVDHLRLAIIVYKHICDIYGHKKLILTFMEQ